MRQSETYACQLLEFQDKASLITYSKGRDLFAGIRGL